MRFLIYHSVQTETGAQPSSYTVRTGGPFSGGNEVLTSPTSAEVKNEWSYTATPLYCFVAWWLIMHMNVLPLSQDSAVSIATGYGLDDRGVGVRVPVRSRIFSSPLRPDRLCGPPTLLSNGYRFPGGKAAGA
jgi:hypothetical protein